MAAQDWRALGLRCGIEIHQQLDTRKLFCPCPSRVRDDHPDWVVVRELRASAGERGEVDAAAAAEQAKGKRYRYEAYSDSTCLVELDEEPPHGLNSEALAITLQVAKLLDAEPVDFLQVMRKTVVDGSNTSGFQRTALVARNGSLVTGHGALGVPSICLEEEAAKIVSRTAEGDTYNLSRLGIPLVEIATSADIASPEMARDVALHIGMLLRSTGRVKRGLGTIRQDLNVSIAGGARVEIKGCQELDMLPTLVECEAMRQKALLGIRDELRSRKGMLDGKEIVLASSDDFPVDITRVLGTTHSKVVKGALDHGGAVLGARLRQFAGLLSLEVQPGRRLGTDLSDYAKAFGGVKGLFHSDELPGYGITPEETAAIRKELGCAASDAFILIADARERAGRAIEAAIVRAKQAVNGVPGEVRKANPDGSSSYMRPMPGSARMYPETDVRGTRITSEMMDALPMPELLDAKEKRLESQYGLSKGVAHEISWSGLGQVFEETLGKWPGLKPAFVADTLVSAPKEIRKRYGMEYEPPREELAALFAAAGRGEIATDAVFEVLVERSQGKPLDLSPYRLLSEREVRERISALVKAHPGVPANGLMGLAMKELRGKAEGSRIAEVLKDLAS